jgi:hypothetical protein
LHFHNLDDIIVLTEKEPLMSDILTQEQLTVSYNPNLLVTYKYVPETYAAPESPTYMTDKVTDIEWQLHKSREYANIAAERRGDIEWIEEQVVEWFDPNYSKEDVLQALIDHFKINPTKQIEVQGTVSFSGTINVPVSELDGFDLSNVTIDVDLSSYEYDADLNVDEVSLEDHY